MRALPPHIAEQAADTHCYVYDLSMLRVRVAEACGLVDDYFYPVKANPEPDLVRAAVDAGAGLDLSSRGDLEVALSSGADPSRCSFTSANLDESMCMALLAAAIDVDLDSADQVALWLRLGGRDAGLRICTADPVSPYGSKFGLRSDAVQQAVELISSSGGRITGLHLHDMHADVTPEAMTDGILSVLESVPEGIVHRCERINIGGGWPMPDGVPATVSDLAPALERLRLRLKAYGFQGKLAAEPGEWVVGPCGWLPGRVSAVKPHPVYPGRLVVVLDVATPVPCRASRSAFAVVRGKAHVEISADIECCDVYGSANTGLDTVGLAVHLPRPQVGDVVVSSGQGAYSRQLVGTFNERPTPGAMVLH